MRVGALKSDGNNHSLASGIRYVFRCSWWVLTTILATIRGVVFAVSVVMRTEAILLKLMARIGK